VDDGDLKELTAKAIQQFVANYESALKQSAGASVDDFEHKSS
jgi:hypothetical protein